MTELQLSDVEQYFSAARSETDQVEYKSYHAATGLEAQLGRVTETVAAFLNSGGGLLVWGAPQGSTGGSRREKVFTGPLTGLPFTVEKDWLVSKIADRIVPLPQGLRVQLVAGAAGQVAVVEVEASSYAPHQTNDRYYMRIDGQSKPAPHHYVEALFKKVVYPNLEVYAKLYPPTPGEPTGSREPTWELRLDFFFENRSPFLNEEKLTYRIGLFTGHFRNSRLHTLAPQPYDMSGRERRSPAQPDLLVHFGQPHHLTEYLVFTESELRQLAGRVSVTVTFGGRAAPLKFSRYYLQFSADRRRVAGYVEHQNQLVAELLAEEDHNLPDRLRDAGIITEPLPPLL